MNVFETREITEDRHPFWKMDLQRISDWRKGIAVARYYKPSFTPSWHYFLIDQKYFTMFHIHCFYMDCTDLCVVELMENLFLVY